MATYAKPKNQSIEEVAWNLAGAELLREIVGESPYLSGVGGDTDFIPEQDAIRFGNAINAYADANPNHENFAWLKHKAKFFLECQGFWQY